MGNRGCRPFVLGWLNSGKLLVGSGVLARTQARALVEIRDANLVVVPSLFGFLGWWRRIHARRIGLEKLSDRGGSVGDKFGLVGRRVAAMARGRQGLATRG